MMSFHPRTLTLGTSAALALLVAPASAELGDPAGVAGAVQGTVALESPARSTSIDQVQSGQDVVMGDAFSTREQSRLQIMLLDQTAITMGQNANLVIDEFVYDPDNANASLSATVSVGAFRLVTGGVARNNPDGTKVKLPSAVLTIRGTTTQGSCDASGCIVALGGTGDQNSAGKRPSQILIQSDKDRKVLKRAGFFVLVRPDGTITDPAPLEDEAAQKLAGLFDPLTGKGAGGDYLGGVDLINASGQPIADGRNYAGDVDDIYDDTTPIENLGFQSTANLPTGQLTYFGDDIAMSGPGAVGDYDVTYSLDLASRDFSGQVDFSVAGTLIGTINGSFELLHNPFEQGFNNLHETGQVIDTVQNDQFVFDYSIGPNQIDTALRYTVDVPAFGPQVITGAGPAPIVP